MKTLKDAKVGESVTVSKLHGEGPVSYTHLLEAALAHEKYVTSLINNIYAAAQKANDFRTTQFLDWFIKEQGEEEKNSSDQITKMRLYGDDARSLYMLNSELLSRTYAAPSLTL